MVLIDGKSLLASCIVFSWCIILSACATAPIQEMSDARQSLQAAHDAGADKYAATTLHSAELALQQAENKLENRAFKEARSNAVTAKIEAMNAQEIAVALGAAESALSKAAIKGVVSPEARALFQQALQAASQGDKQQAVTLANEAKLKVAEPAP
jgi:hypothetical protein